MRTHDGQMIRASPNVPRAVLRELHLMSRTPAPTDLEFARQLAARAELQTGRRVRPYPPRAFVADLIAAGLLLDDDDPTTTTHDDD